METKFINAFLETDTNVVTLEGYNLSHRLNHLVDSLYKVGTLVQYFDRVSGRNIDRINLLPTVVEKREQEFATILKKSESEVEKLKEQIKTLKQKSEEEVYKLKEQILLLKQTKEIDFMERVDDTMNGTTETLVVSAKKRKKV